MEPDAILTASVPMTSRDTVGEVLLIPTLPPKWASADTTSPAPLAFDNVNVSLIFPAVDSSTSLCHAPE